MTVPRVFPLLAAATASLGVGVLTSCYIPPPPPPPPPAVVAPAPAPGPVYQPGYVVTSVPAGYTVRTYRGVPYYNYRGVYYRPHARGYMVVRRPVWW